jgi:hypothetical protein
MNRVSMLTKLMAAALVVMAGVILLASVVTAAGPDVGLPSAATTDGKFIGVSGQGLETFTRPVHVWIGVPASSTTLTLDVFDGDLGGSWDVHDALSPASTRFALYADPTKSGLTAGKTPITTANSATLADNGWSTLFGGPVDAAARAPSGNYFYLLVAEWVDPGVASNEFNAFKLRAGGQVSLSPGTWGFVGAPVNLGVDPAFGTAGNSYNGQWDWYSYVPPEARRVTFGECDADYRLDPTAPGNPPDDLITGPGTPTPVANRQVRISPDVRYSIFRPDGSLLINNTAPSGNSVCESKSADVAAGGLFRWNWLGLDAHNITYLQSAYEVFPAAMTPLPVTFTATPTSTSTRTATATATKTPVPTATPTATARPASSGGNSPAATATTTPVASATPLVSATPVAKATVAPVGLAAGTGPGGATPVTRLADVRLLPKSGGAGALALLVGLMGGALVGAGALLRRSGRRD